WIARGSATEDQPRDRWTDFVLSGLLTLQLAGTAFAAFYDLREPFSCGKETAAYLTASGLKDTLIAAGPDYAGVPAAGYLHQAFYSAQGDRMQTFTRWDRRRIEQFDDREFIRRARQAARPHQSILMLINYPLDPAIGKEAHAKTLPSFSGSIL